MAGQVRITLNGEPYEMPRPMSVGELLSHLGLDARRVAVERNMTVIKRAAFDETVLAEGDQIEVVNIVGGG